MRSVTVLALLLISCAPKVSTKSPTFDEDLPRDTTAAEAAPPVDEARPVAKPGKGERTGVIDRARLLAILDQGPGVFLRQMEVAPSMRGERFVGWQLVQLLDQATLGDVDLAPGDVLLAINGQPLSRPDQLQTLWDSLRTSNQVTAQLWRGEGKFDLAFSVEPKL